MTKELCRMSAFKEQKENIALAIGFFDGLHLGHQILLDEVLKEKDKIPCVLTFQTDFKFNLQNKKIELILTQNEKDKMLESKGIQKEFILPFDEETKNTSISEFLDFLTKLHPSKIVVGKDFSFAKNAIGKAEDLMQLQKTGIKVCVKDLLKEENKKVSSTLIKSLLKEAEIEKANSYLGYDFFLSGIVVHGLENGRKISFPTANIDYPLDKVELKNGVYRTRTAIGQTTYPSMTNIGTHPTIEKLKKRIVETYIIGCDENLYGKEIKVSFLSYLREEKKFSSLQELKKQLTIDAKKCL